VYRTDDEVTVTSAATAAAPPPPSSYHHDHDPYHPDESHACFQVAQHFRADLLASALHDLSLPSLLSAFLFSKGYHAVCTYRIAHAVYRQVTSSSSSSSSSFSLIVMHLLDPGHG
jgi:hypothetical protein